MNPRLPRRATAALCLLGSVMASHVHAAPRGTSDLVSPQKRQASVQLAQQLAHPPAPAALPDELPPLFNPPDFDKPDADELKALQAAGRAAIAAPSAGAAAGPVVPPTDREILEKLSALIPTTGTIEFGGKRLLIMSDNKHFEVGTKFTVSYNNQDYELELVAIDRTTFTLRYRGEEVTRPIIRNR